ncbi:MAG: hypothetical protein EOO40_06190 [Deltaproteobacteria bacterium]|nr:MAG: hypothetical protein EOO40_06190 [Deltaproteobacteria bacterium]
MMVWSLMLLLGWLQQPSTESWQCDAASHLGLYFSGVPTEQVHDGLLYGAGLVELAGDGTSAVQVRCSRVSDEPEVDWLCAPLTPNMASMVAVVAPPDAGGRSDAWIWWRTPAGGSQAPTRLVCMHSVGAMPINAGQPCYLDHDCGHAQLACIDGLCTP